MMVNFIIRRLINSVFLVLLVSMIVFTLIRMVPGDPLSALVDAEQQRLIEGGGGMDPEQAQQILDDLRAQHGLDLPIPIQYAQWLGNMIQGNFGRSIVRGFDIATEIGRRMPITLYLGLIAFIVTNIFGIFWGVIAAVRNGTVVDNVVSGVAILGMTVPGFLMAVVLMYILSFTMEWLPLHGFNLPWRGDIGVSVRSTVMPVMVMTFGGIAGMSRQCRSSMLEVINADYVRTAWAKGMREKVVIFKHVLKNGLMPIVSMQGGMIAGIVGGSVIVETIFNVPGVGSLVVDSMTQLDYPVIQAVTVMFTFITVMANLVVDLLYGWVDPRIRHS
ncbi:MAG: ABC transporter permease [Oscillospiraceae bacterium]|nr:ABC transporter permease [Oscillospiraceae bacterium]